MTKQQNFRLFIAIYLKPRGPGEQRATWAKVFPLWQLFAKGAGLTVTMADARALWKCEPGKFDFAFKQYCGTEALFQEDPTWIP
jgi:hypothetical protein